MEKLSAVVNVVDEEIDVLPRLLSSLKGLVTEIVIVDMTTSSVVKEISSRKDINRYKHKRVNYVEIARNFGISKAKGKWILVVDPDEKVSTKLKSKLKTLLESPVADYYRVPRKNIIFGKWIMHSRWWPDYNIRFFRKGFVSWNEVIHSVPMTKGKGSDLPAKEENAITHYHYETVEQFIERSNRYTTEHAKNLFNDGYVFNWTDIINKPSGEFLSRYFQGEGYKDGLHGLALAGLQAFSELIMYLKVWQLSNFKHQSVELEDVVKKMKKADSDLHYWQSDSLFKEVGGVKHRIKRKLKLP